MIGQALRQLQDALNQKANSSQLDFIAVSTKLQDLSRKIQEVDPADRPPLVNERDRLYDQQDILAEKINYWRDLAHGALHQPNEISLRNYLSGLRALDDKTLNPEIERVFFYLDASDEEIEAFETRQTVQVRPETPVGRLVERARTEYDLRDVEPAARYKAAFEFATRPGMEQNQQAIAELQTFLSDPDPLVQEVITLILIQIYRSRAIHLGDLAVVHDAVQHLASFNHRGAIAPLIEIVAAPRSGFDYTEDGSVVEGNNNRSRLVALQRLIAWDSPDARIAIITHQADRDPAIAEAAQRAIDQHPDMNAR